jgi:hypothetical protein
MAMMTHMTPLTERALRCQFNVKYLSPPARGKTKLIEEIVKRQKELDPEFFFDVWDGGTMQPTDTVMAMPVVETKLIEMFRSGRLPNHYVTPDLRGIIYVGEIPLMGAEVSKGFQKLWNHEDIGGEFRIPAGVIFVGDGNRLTDKSGAQAETRANACRYVTYTLEFDPEHALNVVKLHYHTKVAAFLIRNPTCIDNYEDVFEKDPPRPANDAMCIEGKHGIWASLRSWQRVSDIMFDVEQTGIALLPGEIECNVGDGIAKTFMAFCVMIDHLSSMEDIIANPKKIAIPSETSQQFALATMLSLLVNRDSWEPVATYLQRYPAEIQVVFFYNMNARLEKAKDANTTFIRGTKSYQAWITAGHIAAIMRGASAL